VSGWVIRVPYRTPDDSSFEVVEAIDEILEGEERRVMREIAISAVGRGITSAGELRDELDRVGAVGCRALLDDAREAIGLERSEAIDDREHLEALQRTARLRSTGRGPDGGIQTCGHPDCTAVSADPATGLPKPVRTRRWWCPAHRSHAEVGDDQPPTDVRRIGLHFEEIPAPGEIEAMKAADRRRELKAEQRRQDRAAEAEAIRIAREQYVQDYRDDPWVNPRSGPGWAGQT
jgi:hypothetical protein